MGHIHAADVPFTGPTQIVRILIVWPHRAKSCRANKESVGIVEEPVWVAGPSVVEVIMKIQLGRVSFPDKVLLIDVGHHNLSMSAAENSIEHTVGILLQQIK